MVVYIIMTSFKCLTNEHGCKVGENIRLKKGNQNFDKINKYNKSN